MTIENIYTTKAANFVRQCDLTEVHHTKGELKNYMHDLR